MTPELIAIVFGVISMIGGIIFRDRQLIKAIHDGDEKSRDDAKTGDRIIYEKIDVMGKAVECRFERQRESNHDHYVDKEYFEMSLKNLQEGVARVEKITLELLKNKNDNG